MVTMVTYVDYATAFDKICGNGLLYKMHGDLKLEVWSIFFSITNPFGILYRWNFDVSLDRFKR